MIGVWLMTPRRHWWLCNVATSEDFYAFAEANEKRLQAGHSFDSCRPVYHNGDGGKCDLRSKWGFLLRDHTDEQVSELFVSFRLTMLPDERFAEWLVRCNVEQTIRSTSLV